MQFLALWVAGASTPAQATVIDLQNGLWIRKEQRSQAEDNAA
jgi:hypothetical protein